MNCLTVKLVDCLTAKLVMINSVKLHLTKLITINKGGERLIRGWWDFYTCRFSCQLYNLPCFINGLNFINILVKTKINIKIRVVCDNFSVHMQLQCIT